ncbi:Crp/Fnr family transcriptional regulator [Dethiosulfatarculus sandiegensis]|nr:Crp/Fnr family transcriptional regulator [Dethiosulfatarculus sandiegensis]
MPGQIFLLLIKGGSNNVELNQKIAILNKTLGFEELDPDQLANLAELSSIRFYKKGEYIFHEGDTPRYFKVVVEGLVKLSKSTESGKAYTAVMGWPGDTLNAVTLFEDLPRFLSAQAIRTSTILCLKKTDFVDFVFQHPTVALRIIKILGHLVQTSYERILDMVAEKAEQRIINMLFMLYKKFGHTLNFTNQELADLVGATTETTIRIMGQLRKQGIVQSARGRIQIADPVALEKLGRGPFWA